MKKSPAVKVKMIPLVWLYASLMTVDCFLVHGTIQHNVLLRHSSKSTQTSRWVSDNEDQSGISSSFSIISVPPILYESDSVLAISKPPHIPHHNSEEEIGIMSHIRILQDSDKFPYKGRLYGVHRLDRCTSGVLLFAKNKEAATLLSRSFRDKEVTKYYVALSGKKPKKKKQGWVRGGMTPSRRGAWKLTNEMGTNPAVTRFYSAGLGSCELHNFHEDLVMEDSSELLCKTMILFEPHTGKTHQLRVAAKSLGLPILGDKMYGDAVEAGGFERTYLHALAIDVTLNDERITIFNPPSWFISTQQSNDDDSSSPKAEGVLESLLQKHCKNEFILDKLSLYYQYASM